MKIPGPINGLAYLFGGILILFGLALSTRFSIFIILVIPGILAFLVQSGYEFDAENDQYREYTSCLGLRFGKWKSMRKVTGITILSTRMKSGVHDRFGRGKAIDHTMVTQLVLLDQTHLRKITVAQSKRLLDIKEYAEGLSLYIQRPLVKYNPQHSRKRR